MSELEDIREGVRRGIRDALECELDRTSARTTGRVVAAGALGLLTACAALLLFSRSAMGELAGLPLALCAAAWSSLLVLAFTVVLLQVGTRQLPLAEAALLALLGFVLAAGIGAICPHPRIMMQWVNAAMGWVGQPADPSAAAALCVGLCTALLTGGGAAILLGLRGVRFGVHLSAAMLFLVLWPAVFVQALGTGATTFVAWSVGVAAGAWSGVAAGAMLSRIARTAIRASA
jgi:hypothetical protein